MTKQEWAFNEWMRRYIDEPERFESEIATVRQFLKETKRAEQQLSYGEEQSAYLQKLEAEAPDDEQVRIMHFQGWEPGSDDERWYSNG